MKFYLGESLAAATPKEAAAFKELAAQLAFDVEPRQPRADLKARVMVATQVHVVRGVDSEWKATQYAGVSYKSLFVDQET